MSGELGGFCSGGKEMEAGWNRPEGSRNCP